MRRNILYVVGLLILFLTACSERESLGETMGTLRLNVGVEDNVKVSSRALSTDEQELLKSNCKIRVFEGTTLIRKYQGVNAMPSDGLQLLSGTDYSVRVTAGDSVAASFEKKFFEGKQVFTITRGQISPVNVVCKLANTLTKVNFAQSLDNAFSSYKAVIGTSAGSLEYVADNGGTVGYYTLPKGVTALDWTFTATTLDGRVFTRTGKIEEALAATQYTLTYNYEPDTSEHGGGMLTIDVDTTPLEENTSGIVIYQRPTIKGLNAQNEPFDIAIPTYVEIGAGAELSLWIATSCPLTSAVISCDNFQKWELPVNSIDLVTMKASEKAKLAEKGVIVTNRYEIGAGASDGRGNMGIRFSEALMNKISMTEGAYSIYLTAVDNKGNRRSVEWKIVVSNATVVTEEVVDAEVWSSKATLRASVAKEPLHAVTFRYRKSDSTDWTSVAAERNNNMIYANITGLAAGTQYEYAVVDGTAVSSVICSFTTEKKVQLPNAGFEDWHGSKPSLIYANGGEMFWDSGNHGSKTGGTDITESDNSVKHGGNYSVRLTSKSIVGQFAAGNLFAGKYLETKMDGLKGNGILGWGRPFASRPKALHGYIRYKSINVDKNNKCPFINTGDPDQGIVYIALGDWKGEAYGSETWPVVIKTNYNNASAAQLFDSSEANTNIIAYGEQVWSESTPGEGMIEFTINLDYRTTSRKPTSLVLVASASKYGDYFTGGVGSTMWLDDLEFIYE